MRSLATSHTRVCLQGLSLQGCVAGASPLSVHTRGILSCCAWQSDLDYALFIYFFLFEGAQGLVARIVNTRRRAKFQGPSIPGTGSLSTNQFSLVGQVTETDVWSL